jgi:hypothetical protein
VLKREVLNDFGVFCFEEKMREMRNDSLYKRSRKFSRGSLYMLSVLEPETKREGKFKDIILKRTEFLD